jgi:hypothetical protein
MSGSSQGVKAAVMQLMDYRKLSVARVAHRLGWLESHLALRLGTRDKLTDSELAAIGAVLGVEPDWFEEAWTLSCVLGCDISDLARELVA